MSANSSDTFSVAELGIIKEALTEYRDNQRRVARKAGHEQNYDKSSFYGDHAETVDNLIVKVRLVKNIAGLRK